jgi:peptidoglycan DL-endopeptidase LytF
MTRKDTILVAALINAGLLIVLFVSALKNSEDTEKVAFQKDAVEQAPREVAVYNEPKKIAGDEVDLVLKQYTQPDPLQIPVVAQAPSAPNFVEDLQGIVQAAPISVATAAAAPVTSSYNTETPQWIEVKVKKGDVLEKIAKQHRTTVTEIMKTNHLSSTQLKIGQVLKIASSSKEAAAPKMEPSVAVLDSAPGKFYTVKSGDSPWTIAVKNHMKVEDLLKLNNMTEEKARKLRPGDQIRIR